MTSVHYLRPSWPNLHQSLPQETSKRTSPFSEGSEVSKVTGLFSPNTLELINTSHTQIQLNNHSEYLSASLKK